MISTAVKNDITKILEIEELIMGHKKREVVIEKSILLEQCLVKKEKGKINGYLIFNENFYENNFIELLMVHPKFQNTGIGSSLINHYERMINNGKIFTSTNLSNQKMIHLLKKLNYVDSGIIYNLDENDPELMFFKQI